MDPLAATNRAARRVEMQENAAHGGIDGKPVQILDLLAAIADHTVDGVAGHAALGEPGVVRHRDDGGQNEPGYGEHAPEGQAALEALAVDQGVGFQGHVRPSGERKEGLLF